MKNFVSGLILILLVGLFVSCVSLNDREMTRTEMVEANIVGSVTVNFTTFRFLHFVGNRNIQTKAHQELMREARQEHGLNIEIRNIAITGGFSPWQAVMIGVPTLGAVGMFIFEADLGIFGGLPLIAGVNMLGNFQEITATGDVVLLGGTSGSRRTNAVGIEGALERAAEEVSENFTARTRLAIVYITAQDKSTTDFITGELEHILRRQGFAIIDRSELDRIRSEQRFGLTGEVDDNTAARIGNIAGASVVITGRVDGEGNLRRLRLRALETSSGQVIGTASERL